MQLDRRSFLKLSLAGTFAVTFGCDTRDRMDKREEDTHTGFQKVAIIQQEPKTGTETITICPYCAVGCGIIVTSAMVDGAPKVVVTEGNPDHPINQGSLCAKGSALVQIPNSPERLTTPQRRDAGASTWTDITWDEAINEIAALWKSTRDANFELTEGPVTVNRTRAIALVGGAALDNEECYLAQKLFRAMGTVWIENQARICHSATVAGLATSFGSGAMTNHWIDIKNSDCIMIIGSNAAENHPISMKYVMKARDERGAKLISVDPRFTRTSAVADVYGRLRSGTDIAFIGGLIRYALVNNLYDSDYVKNYTNAPILVDSAFTAAYDVPDTGIFPGYDAPLRSYDRSTWNYGTTPVPTTDLTLADPDCVFQRLLAHYDRYTPAMVSEITGMDLGTFNEIAATYCATGAQGKTATIMYAMGATQHTCGSQNVRSYAILQLLLGNVGRPGGGINALRGESNVQGSTDHAVLFHILPGYLKTPSTSWPAYADYIALKSAGGTTPDTINGFTDTGGNPRSSLNWRGGTNTAKYMASLLRAFWKDQSKTLDEIYQWQPKLTAGQNYSHISLFEAIDAGTIKGLFCFGQNPAVSGPSAVREINAIGKLDFLVAVDLWGTETSEFWNLTPGVDPADINTVVYRLPARSSIGKEGSISNSGRWAQWRYPAKVDGTHVPGPGEAHSDLRILNDLARKLKELYTADALAPVREAMTYLNWDYGPAGLGPDVRAVAKEINGYDIATDHQLLKFTELKDDGTTLSGNWLYCGSYVAPGDDFLTPNDNGNRMEKMIASTAAEDPLGLNPNWAWCWPINRRIVYNGASLKPADTTGAPFDANRHLVYWAGAAWATSYDGRLYDVNDDIGAPATRMPFIMMPDGCGHLFSLGAELVDGPFPEHYEPWETPLADNPITNNAGAPLLNPVAYVYQPVDQGDPVTYPIVCTTFRLAEHWQAGAMTRNLPWLIDCQPEMFVELSEELAVIKNDIVNGDTVRIWNKRGVVFAKAMVTKRFKPLSVAGQTVHQIGMPWHWGNAGLNTGDSANNLTPHIGDANTRVPEYKAFLVDIEKV